VNGRAHWVVVVFVAEAVLAGGNAVGIRYSNRELAPLWGAGLRFSLAAALLIGITIVMRLRLPRGRALAGAILYGAIGFGASFGLAYYALVRIHAGLAQTLLALVPLATLLLAVLQHQERMRVRAVAGALLAVGGIGLMSGPSSEALPLLSLLAVLACVLCFAQAAVLVRRLPRVHPVTMNAVAMATAVPLLVLASLLAGEPMVLPRSAATWMAIAYTVAIGSVVVFVLYLVLLHHWDASRVAYGFVLTPIVTVGLSAWLDNEPLDAALVIGGLLVLIGVYIGALRPPPVQPPGDRARAST